MGISIFEGERPLTKHNHALGKFDLSGIPPAPRGQPQIEVTFEVDENSILKVSAVEKATGKSDKNVKEKIDAKNSLENYIYSMKNTVEDKDKLADKLQAGEKEEIMNAIKEH